MNKRCYKCTEMKSLTSFSSDQTRSDGRHSLCKQCRATAYQLNKAKILEQSKAWYNKNAITRCETSRVWRSSNLARHKALVSRWRNRNSALKNAHTANYRARKIQATPPWLTADQYQAIAHFYVIAKQLESTTGIPHHVDHIHPLHGIGFSGLHVPWNLQVIPATDNLIKRNTLPHG